MRFQVTCWVNKGKCNLLKEDDLSEVFSSLQMLQWRFGEIATCDEEDGHIGLAVDRMQSTTCRPLRRWINWADAAEVQTRHRRDVKRAQRRCRDDAWKMLEKANFIYCFCLSIWNSNSELRSREEHTVCQQTTMRTQHFDVLLMRSAQDCFFWTASSCGFCDCSRMAGCRINRWTCERRVRQSTVCHAARYRSAIAGLIRSFFNINKPIWWIYTAPVYIILQGLFISSGSLHMPFARFPNSINFALLFAMRFAMRFAMWFTKRFI